MEFAPVCPVEWLALTYTQNELRATLSLCLLLCKNQVRRSLVAQDELRSDLNDFGGNEFRFS
jgi:hypothetical protein